MFISWCILLGLAQQIDCLMTRSPDPADRRVVAWFGPDHSPDDQTAVIEQLESNRDVFDAIYAGGCGLRVDSSTPTAPRLILPDESLYEKRCGKLSRAVQAAGLEMQMWIYPSDSAKIFDATRHNSVDVSELVASSTELCKKYGWAGINYDDERDGCPRRNTIEFDNWLTAVDSWAQGMHQHGLKLTVDIQYVTCTIARNNTNRLAGYDALSAKYARTKVDEWLEMDTYYGNLDFFYDNLDYYLRYFPSSTLGIGMLPNANPQDLDHNIARFHALHRANTSIIAIFRVPVKDDVFLRLLRKWKTRCKHCPDEGVLTCWESGVTLPPSGPNCM